MPTPAPLLLSRATNRQPAAPASPSGRSHPPLGAATNGRAAGRVIDVPGGVRRPVTFDSSL